MLHSLWTHRRVFMLKPSQNLNQVGNLEYTASRLTFSKHVSMVAWSCNYHVQPVHHIRHLQTTDLAQPLACSLILSKIDYCNAVLHGTPTYTIQNVCRTTQLGSFNRCQDDPPPARCSARCIGCMFSRESTTKWLCWCSRSAEHRCRPTSITRCRRQRTSTTCYAHQPPPHCDNHSPRQQTQSEPSAAHIWYLLPKAVQWLCYPVSYTHLTLPTIYSV